MKAARRDIRRFAVVSITLMTVGWGVQAAIGRVESSARPIILLGLALACTVWCAADSAARGQTLVWPARIGIFLFGLIGVLIYLVWSRGARGVVTAVLVSIGWIAVTFAAFMLSGYLAYGAAWFGRGE